MEWDSPPNEDRAEQFRQALRHDAWLDSIEGDDTPTHRCRVEASIAVDLQAAPWLTEDEALSLVLSCLANAEFGAAVHDAQAYEDPVVITTTEWTGAMGRIEEVR